MLLVVTGPVLSVSSRAIWHTIAPHHSTHADVYLVYTCQHSSCILMAVCILERNCWQMTECALSWQMEHEKQAF